LHVEGGIVPEHDGRLTGGDKQELENRID